MYSLVDFVLKKATREKDSQMKIFEQTNNIKLNHDSRLNQIQQQLGVLNEREAQINQVNFRQTNPRNSNFKIIKFLFKRKK